MEGKNSALCLEVEAERKKSKIALENQAKSEQVVCCTHTIHTGHNASAMTSQSEQMLMRMQGHDLENLTAQEVTNIKNEHKAIFKRLQEQVGWSFADSADCGAGAQAGPHVAQENKLRAMDVQDIQETVGESPRGYDVVRPLRHAFIQSLRRCLDRPFNTMPEHFDLKNSSTMQLKSTSRMRARSGLS